MRRLETFLNTLTAPLTLWWRDDDLIKPTPQGDHLLALAETHSIPLHVAVVPLLADKSLTTWLPANVTVLQHGIRHENNAAPDHKKCELTHDVSISNLRKGHERLKNMFDDQHLAICVPPWNRVHPSILHQTIDIYKAVSTFHTDKMVYPLPTFHTHLDLMDWDARDVKSHRQIEEELINCLGLPGPIGLLTHHLVHSPAYWETLDLLFSTLQQSPYVTFTSLRKWVPHHLQVESI